ncbi:MAG: protein-L-isoaspartate(D-aspartate) O-methyltransferase [Pirellulales bacterium]|nr:protein-L-isoaspartate(D-aspartate) O-methyltransferase [Pirellulales bacterium]
MIRFSQQRQQLVEQQVKSRGIKDPAVLAAVASVPREKFLPPELAEFAYHDRALPIEKGQTISQPYIVALMTEALELRPSDRVLEVGTGSGYAAAILGRIAREVFTIERHAELAEQAAGRLREQGFNNVHVLHGDGTLGWPSHAPYDAIVVAAGGPEVPPALLEQLAVGGRLVIPVGEEKTLQSLVRVTRTGPESFRREDLGDVRFVPLIGAGGWKSEEVETETLSVPQPKPSAPATVAELIRETIEPLQEIETANLGPLGERIGDSRVVLIGEATHGTSEFYRLRAEITKQLIQHRGFKFVAIEADWPDAARIDQYVRRLPPPDGRGWQAFARFPTWMWRNREMLAFIEWLREFNLAIEDPRERVALYGLDLYSVFTSIRAVLEYLDRVDPEAARVARLRYGCLTPWEGDPALYGKLAVAGRYRVCEQEAVAMLKDLLQQRLQYAQYDGALFLDAVQNARLVANAERYYRVMYYGSNESWNHRDHHMFETLELVLGYHGGAARGVVWEHNSHLGDAAATDMGAGGQTNVGHLCRQRFGQGAYLIGQGTDHGTVAAAHNWDEPVEFMNVRPGHPGSYEALFHESRVAAGLLHLRKPHRTAVREELTPERLERAIGVVYRPQTELASHYFHARLAEQFDEFIWFDSSRAVTPITSDEARRFAPEHPFSLHR